MSDFLAMVVGWVCVAMLASVPFWAVTMYLVEFEDDEATYCNK